MRVHLIQSVDDAAAFLRWLSTRTEVALDVEASGLDKDVDVVRLVQFGDQREAYVIPFERWAGVVDDALARFEGTYVTHNGPSYDCPLLRRAGCDVPRHRVHDTRLMLHVLESTGSTALKSAAKRLVDPRADLGQERLDEAMRRGGWTWATVPVDLEPYWLYAGVDTVLTQQLKDVLWPRVQAEAPASYDLELAVSWVTERMERRGVRVDRDYTETFAAELHRYVVDVEAWCQATYGLYPGSNRDVVAALQRDGVEFTKYTTGGAISLDKFVLAELDHPLARAVLGRRQAQKITGTYLDNYLRLSQRDDRIHPSINVIGGTDKNPFEPGGGKGVRTGRMSMNDPNLQNVPIRGKEGKRIRNCFVASDEHTWIKCDFDQIEMRCMAHLAEDDGMIAAFRADGDFFVNLAVNLFNELNFQRSDPRRQLVKNGGYAKIYGAGVRRFAETAGVGYDEGAAFMRRFDALYPGVTRWVKSIEREAQRTLLDEGEAYVRSPLTNRRHVADAGRLYSLVNYEIQGMAGELLKMKMIELDAAGLGDYMTIPVHDEVDLDVPDTELGNVLTTLKDVMHDPSLLCVPITSSIETGTRWGECD